MTRLPEFSLTLWRQRRLLDALLYRLEVQELLLTSGRHRWLPNATRELEAVIAKLRRHELVRAVQASALARELGLPPDPTLRMITEAAPPPWCEILREHHIALLGLSGQVADLADRLRDELAASSRGIAEFLDAVVEPMRARRDDVPAPDPTPLARPTRPDTVPDPAVDLRSEL